MRRGRGLSAVAASALTGLLLVALAGCGGSSDGADGSDGASGADRPATTAAPDPTTARETTTTSAEASGAACSYISVAGATGILGAEAQAPPKETYSPDDAEVYDDTCVYTASLSDGGTATLTVVNISPPANQSMRTFWDGAKAKATRTAAIDGCTDAFWTGGTVSINAMDLVYVTATVAGTADDVASTAQAADEICGVLGT